MSENENADFETTITTLLGVKTAAYRQGQTYLPLLDYLIL